MTAKEKNKLVGIFLMAHSGLQAFAMIIVGLIYGGIGVAMLLGGRKNEDQLVGIVFIAMIAVLAIVALLFILPQVLGGYKIFKEKPNARNWGIAGSILSCLSVPLGTAAGIFGLVFLLGDEGKGFYLIGTPQNVFNPQQQPPPPNSWQ